MLKKSWVVGVRTPKEGIERNVVLCLEAGHRVADAPIADSSGATCSNMSSSASTLSPARPPASTAPTPKCFAAASVSILCLPLP